MRFSINRELFTKKLDAVDRVIPQNSPTTELTGIFIQVFQDHIVLTGSDKTKSAQVILSPDEQNNLIIEETGSIVIKSSALVALMRQFNGDTVQAESIDDAQIRFYGQNGDKFDLIGFAGSNYPHIDLSQPASHLALPVRDLHTIYNQVGFACATNTPRVYLTGINIRIQDHQLSATATDTISMARKVLPVQTDAAMQVTLPKTALQTVTSLLNDEDQVDLYFDRKKMQFVSGDLMYQTTLLDGAYPDCDRLLKTKSKIDIELNNKQFEAMISRTTIYTADKAAGSGVVPVLMEYGPDTISVDVLNSTLGSCRQFMDDFSGADYQGKIAFNGTIMLNALHAIRSAERITLHLGDDVTPIRISVPSDPSIEMLLVPLRAY